ncbi:hypothetical protein ABW20_dc0100286 [Dactylellina cionopaga]|nr:hypothetical protein ABW20_dc0100286 [Dactylellina cionopaga]
MSVPTKSVAFFGATGGSVLASLELSLRSGYHCSALVRSADKLKGLLAKTTPIANLRIVEGDALNPVSVRDVLVDPSTNTVVDTIINGLGGHPSGNNPLTWTFSQPTICEDTTKVIMATLEELKPATAPFAFFISTTGVDNERDVPALALPFYHYSLKVPHIDKGKMEELVVVAGEKGLFRNWTIIRPSLLTDGEATYGKIQVGYKDCEKSKGLNGELTLAEGGCGWKGVKGQAIGYVISRKDVGAFVFEEGVVHGGDKFKGKKVTLTH